MQKTVDVSPHSVLALLASTATPMLDRDAGEFTIDDYLAEVERVRGYRPDPRSARNRLEAEVAAGRLQRGERYDADSRRQCVAYWAAPTG